MFAKLYDIFYYIYLSLKKKKTLNNNEKDI